MDRYLQTHFNGKYRIRADYDLNTNDFVRDEFGNLDQSFGDFYIKCKKGVRIRHLYRNMMDAYIPNVRIGKNYLIKMYKEVVDNFEDDVKFGKAYKKLKSLGLIEDVIETDAELQVKFKVDKTEQFAKLFGAEKTGVSIPPFSNKNLPKEPYNIPQKDLNNYKEIIKDIEMLDISKLNKMYREQFKNEHKNVDLQADMRKQKLIFKNYIHKNGYWDEYCNFLKNNKEVFK